MRVIMFQFFQKNWQAVLFVEHGNDDGNRFACGQRGLRSGKVVGNIDIMESFERGALESLLARGGERLFENPRAAPCDVSENMRAGSGETYQIVSAVHRRTEDTISFGQLMIRIG